MKNHPVNNDYVQNLQEGLLSENQSPGQWSSHKKAFKVGEDTGEAESARERDARRWSKTPRGQREALADKAKVESSERNSSDTDTRIGALVGAEGRGKIANAARLKRKPARKVKPAPNPAEVNEISKGTPPREPAKMDGPKKKDPSPYAKGGPNKNLPPFKKKEEVQTESRKKPEGTPMGDLQAADSLRRRENSQEVVNHEVDAENGDLGKRTDDWEDESLRGSGRHLKKHSVKKVPGAKTKPTHNSAGRPIGNDAYSKDPSTTKMYHKLAKKRALKKKFK